MSNSYDHNPKIVDLTGKPIGSEPSKRFAIVGRVHVHYSLFALEEGATVENAVDTFNMMVQQHSLKLEHITKTKKFFWAEDDETRAESRTQLIQQIYLFLMHLMPDGTLSSEKEIGGLVDQMLNLTPEAE